MTLTADQRKAMFAQKPPSKELTLDEIERNIARSKREFQAEKKEKGRTHIQVIKNELDNNLIKMKNSPDNLNIIKERENLQKQLKQLRKKHGDQS